MAVTIWRQLLVDRVGITGQIQGFSLYKYLQGQIRAMKEEQKTFLPTGKITTTKNKYSIRLDYYAVYTWKKAGRRKIADITLGAYKIPGKKSGGRYLTLTLYPSQFQGEEFANFKSIFSSLFDPVTYAVLYHTGKVNYLELAVDSHSHKQHSFLPYRKYCTDSKIFEETNGHLGSTYLGSVTSNLRFRVYDKYKQLLDTGKPVVTKGLPHTRIEAVMRRLGIAPVELVDIEKNPFKALRIADLQLAKSASSDNDWQMFLADSLTVGVPKALAQRPMNIRKKYSGILDSLQVSWWKPGDVWEYLPITVAKIVP